MNIELKNKDYQQLISQISDTFVLGQKRSVLAVNTHLIETYWKIGEYIVEYEQGGSGKAEYGKQLLERLSKDLSLLHGKGFSRSNMQRMKQFYLAFPICATPSHKLSWSHYVELLKIDDPLERGFYEQQTLKENWSVAQLIRQKRARLKSPDSMRSPSLLRYLYVFSFRQFHYNNLPSFCKDKIFRLTFSRTVNN